MKKDKKFNKELSAKTLAYLEVLKKHYKVDVENRTITIPLHYDKASDLVDEDLGDKNNPSIKREILARFCDILHHIPLEFKFNLDLKINDYEGYDHKVLSSALIDEFVTFQYDISKEKTISNLKVVFLVVVSVVVYVLLFFLCSKNLFGQAQEGYVHNTIHEIIYSIGAVLLCEAIYIIFLPETTYGDISYELLQKVNVIRFLNKKNKELISIDNATMAKHWNVEPHSQVRMKKLFLILGTGLLCMAGCQICDLVDSFILIHKFSFSWILALIQCLEFIFITISGIGAISYYRDKGPFKKLILVFGIISALMSISKIIMLSIFFEYIPSQAIKGLVFGCIILVVSILYVVCAIILNKKKHMAVNKANKKLKISNK